MGSILSFIVLCIANSGIVSLTLDPISVNFDRDILINGDDGLFKGTDSEYAFWESLASEVGLEPSVGKTYRSSEFCVINSELYYRTDTRKSNGSWEVAECPYANMMGLTPYNAKSADRTKSPCDLEWAHPCWMRGFSSFDNEKKLAAERLWYRTHSGLLHDQRIHDVSWYLRPSLGGLGLPLPLAGNRDDLVLTPYQVARVRSFISHKQKRGIVRAYVSVDYKDLPPACQTEALNELFGQGMGLESSDTFKSSLPLVTAETTKAAKVVGLVSEIRVKVYDVKDNRRRWYLGSPADIVSTDISLMAEAVTTNTRPYDVLLNRKSVLGDTPPFFKTTKFDPNFHLNRELRVKDMNQLRVELISSKFDWSPPIPESKNFPWMLPYRGLLEEIRVSRLLDDGIPYHKGMLRSVS